jgi:hypothetical protein
MDYFDISFLKNPTAQNLIKLLKNKKFTGKFLTEFNVREDYLRDANYDIGMSKKLFDTAFKMGYHPQLWELMLNNAQAYMIAKVAKKTNQINKETVNSLAEYGRADVLALLLLDKIQKSKH